MDPSMPSEGMVWLLTQGVLGFTTAAAGWAAIKLFRLREADRLRYEATMTAKDQAHDVEIAQWVKLNQELQAERVRDTALQSDRLANSNDLIRQLWQAKGGQIEKAS